MDHCEWVSFMKYELNFVKYYFEIEQWNSNASDAYCTLDLFNQCLQLSFFNIICQNCYWPIFTRPERLHMFFISWSRVPRCNETLVRTHKRKWRCVWQLLTEGLSSSVSSSDSKFPTFGNFSNILQLQVSKKLNYYRLKCMLKKRTKLNENSLLLQNCVLHLFWRHSPIPSK